MAQKRHIVQYDSSIFHVNQYDPKHWAPSGRPLLVAKKYYAKQLVCVFGAISVERGWVYRYVEQRGSFKTWHTLRFFRDISRARDQTDLVLFGDNATVHNNQTVRDWAGENDVELLWNLKYEPSLNGIEYAWAIAKDRYRRRLAELLVNRQTVNNYDLVLEVLNSITDDEAKGCAMRGWRNLMRKVPKDYDEV